MANTSRHIKDVKVISTKLCRCADDGESGGGCKSPAFGLREFDPLHRH